jgi:phosphoribosyl 1,2-cyclic phosphodiesterase
MFVRFWGVRGSYPVPGEATCRYGGHTPCVQVCPDDESVVILDAGTGLRRLGKVLVGDAVPGSAAVTKGGDRRATSCGRGEGHCHLLISHTHWDHIQGLPFFAPLYVPGNRVTIYGRQREVHLGDIFAGQTQDPYFPVSLQDVGADVGYRELIEGTRFALGDSIEVSCARLNHPYIAVGYRVDADGGSVAYISDTAPFDRIVLGYDFVPSTPDVDKAPPEKDAAVLQAMREGVLELCRDVDLVIFDTMFEMSEYRSYPHWGHSAPEHAVAVAEEAGARALALFHHHPARSDEQLDAIHARVAASTSLHVIAAREGLEVDCTGSGVEERS